MNFFSKSSLPIFIMLTSAGLVLILFWLGLTVSLSYDDMQMILTTNTQTFGTLLGIITAGLMFTQGKFSELTSKLTEKSPEYLTQVLSIQRIQPIETQLFALKKAFTQLADDTTIAEEKNLYERIAARASSIFVDFAALLNLKLIQEGVVDSRLFVSEMDPSFYKAYQKTIQSIKKEWQIFTIIKRIVDTWETRTTFSSRRSNREPPLQVDLKKAIPVLKLKENVDKINTNIRVEANKTCDELDKELGEINKKLHEDGIPQILPQMKLANTLRGRYFYLTLVFIATPLLINISVLTQLSEATTTIFQPIILVTTLLSVLGVIFLLLYIQKILSV